MKIWSIKNPLFGGLLIAFTFSQAAEAAELPPSQPLPTPGIPTPDYAVRQMATNVVLDSRASAVLTNIAKPIDAEKINPIRPTSPLPLTAGLPNPSRVLSSCPANVCGFVATQPPVSLGTASHRVLAKMNKTSSQILIPTTLKLR